MENKATEKPLLKMCSLIQMFCLKKKKNKNGETAFEEFV